MNAKASVSYVYMPCDTVNYLRCIFRRCIHCTCSTCLHVYSTLCSPEYFARSNTQIHTHTYILHPTCYEMVCKWNDVGNRYIGQINEAFKIHSPAAWHITLHNLYSIASAKLKCIHCSMK